MSPYPRVWTIRHGADAGKVLIQFSPAGPLLLVGPDGAVTEQYRTPRPPWAREKSAEVAA